MTDPLLFGKNLVFIRELREDIQPVAYAWHTECFNAGKEFEIVSAFRTASYQNYLYQQGRTRPGPIVTYDDGYKLISHHQLRLALDLNPINCTYQDIADIAAEYLITHPYPSEKAAENKGFIDEPHFEFDHASIPIPPAAHIIDPLVRLKGLATRLSHEKNPTIRPLISGAIKGIQRRLGISSSPS